MKILKLKRLVRICSILTSVAVFTTFTLPSYAEDSVETLENTTSNLQNELSDLNSELANLSTELDSILKKMEETTAEINQTKQDLANAKGEEEAQYKSMKSRIKQIYESGNTSFLEMLFSSTSMAELLNTAEFISAINEYDKQMLDKLVTAKNTVEEKEALLEQEQKNLSALKAELKKKETTLTDKISSTSGELAQYTAQLEAAKKRAEEAQKALEKEVTPIPPKQEEKPKVETPKEEIPDKPSKPNPPAEATASDVELLAALIECEAGSTDYEGMLAVGAVVINRMNHRHYPNSIYGVIYQSGQFSPASSGKLEKVLKRGAKPSCFVAARDAISGKNNIGSCLNFRAASSGHSGILLGGNVFF